VAVAFEVTVGTVAVVAVGTFAAAEFVPTVAVSAAISVAYTDNWTDIAAVAMAEVVGMLVFEVAFAFEDVDIGMKAIAFVLEVG